MAQVPELTEAQSEESRSLLPRGNPVRGASFGVRTALLVGASLLLATGGASYLRLSPISPGGIIEAAGYGVAVGSMVTCSRAFQGPGRVQGSGKVTSVEGSHIGVDLQSDNPNGGIVYFKLSECQLNGQSLIDKSCSADGEDCRSSQCCRTLGSQCYRKNDYWASCNATCSSNMLWEGGRWVDTGAQHNWDCQVCDKKMRTLVCDASLSCDTSSCNGASGEQRQNCEEHKMRDCCLRDSCKGAQGEQVALCHRDHIDKCCAGKSIRCKQDLRPANNGGQGFNPGNGGQGFNPGNGGQGFNPGNGGQGFNPGTNAACDMSSCGSSNSAQAQLCREQSQRNCCLDEQCRGAQGGQVGNCYAEKLAVCCAGKSPQCATM